MEYACFVTCIVVFSETFIEVVIKLYFPDQPTSAVIEHWV
jgi:hypothetical protein